MLHQPDRGPAAVHDAPEVDVEELALVGQRHLRQLPVDRQPGVIHPGVDRAELEQGRFAEPGHRVWVGDVGRRPRRRGRRCGADLVGHAAFRSSFVARRQDDARAAARRHPRGREPDAARCAGDHDDLVLQWLECVFWLFSSCSLRVSKVTDPGPARRSAGVNRESLVTLDEIRAARDADPVHREGHAAGRRVEPRGAAALAEVREPAAGRRVQDPRRLQHGRAADGRTSAGAASSPIRRATTARRSRIAARALGAPAVVVMPTTAPKIKSEGAKGFGAEVVFEGTTSLHRRAKAEEIAAARGLTMVPPFDHEWIIAGQGTLGLEILEQCRGRRHGAGPDRRRRARLRRLGRDQAVDSPAGSRSIGIEPSGAAGDEELDRGRRSADARGSAQHRRRPDGGRVPAISNFAHVRKFVDRIDTVDDDEIAAAVRWLFVQREDRRRAERRRHRRRGPARVRHLHAPVVAIISGGNLDPADLAKYTVVSCRDRRQEIVSTRSP